ncbi:hypothetical protein AXF42_Ash020397 [Apostasia shenzhenica]|uniref:Reactive oxygen species modulator 1 n=1 Tax=Apostasia shenzhenica TaxID=1088818 RepID=A0A2I0AA83_9ASPA|nr:hypothetical protein AXF42_Ash020397 [Apostasia shenzhenica]
MNWRQRLDTRLRVLVLQTLLFSDMEKTEVAISEVMVGFNCICWDSCMARVATGAAVGGAVGGAVGAVYGTYEAIRYKVPGLLKIRHIGQTTLGSAAVFGLFLGAGSLIHCGKSY